MSAQDMGASADADRACALRAEPAAQSQAEPLVPSAGMFGVLRSYDYPVVEITRVSEQCFWSRGGRYRGDRETRAYLEKLVCWSVSRGAAERASKQMVSAEAERDRRAREARQWFDRETAKIAARALASGIEAATAGETRSGSTEGESAVPCADTADAQPTPGDSNG